MTGTETPKERIERLKRGMIPVPGGVSFRDVRWMARVCEAAVEAWEAWQRESAVEEADPLHVNVGFSMRPLFEAIEDTESGA